MHPCSRDSVVALGSRTHVGCVWRTSMCVFSRAAVEKSDLFER